VLAPYLPRTWQIKSRSAPHEFGSTSKSSLAVIPGRNKPEDPIPMFELTVKAPAIADVRFSGPRSGEYLAADELRFTPLFDSSN
jgi:hypothetical protein